MDFIAHMEARLQSDTEELAEISEHEKKIAAKKEQLLRDIEGWRVAIAAERRKTGVGLPIADTKPPNSEPAPVFQPANDTEYGAKKEFLRTLLQQHAIHGIAPREIRRAARTAGLTCGTSFPYSALNKLKSDQEAVDRNGRWYPISGPNGYIRPQ